MLTPFPSPPAIRKVPDNVFEQIATNLRSATLAQIAGYTIPGYSRTGAWLKSLQPLIGHQAMRQLLVEQQAEIEYADLLDD